MKNAHPTPELRPGFEHAAADLGAMYAPTPLRLSLTTDFEDPPATRIIDAGRIDKGGMRIYHLNGATVAQATALGEALLASKRFAAIGTTECELRQDGDQLVLSFVVADDHVDDATTGGALAEVGRELGEHAFARPLHVRQCDSEYARCKLLR
ncbi:MAG: hypothetical protein JWN44_3023 [Myxococcales bacterium]|nr:hypothetical protein [Myxococcales bacterium]